MNDESYTKQTFGWYYMVRGLMWTFVHLLAGIQRMYDWNLVYKEKWKLC